MRITVEAGINGGKTSVAHAIAAILEREGFSTVVNEEIDDTNLRSKLEIRKDPEAALSRVAKITTGPVEIFTKQISS